MARIAIVQMSSTAAVVDNLQQVNSLVGEAANKGARLLVLPENFAYMAGPTNEVWSVAERPGAGPIQDRIATLAQQYKIWIVAGSIPLHSPIEKRVFSACMVYNESGENCARYDKIHMFDVRISDVEMYKESDRYIPGNAVVCVDTPVGRIGLSICYDLRFAQLYRTLLNGGAEIFIVPAAFTATTGKAHWEVLLRARAIENLTYTIAANQCGTHANGFQTWGHSMAIDPWGSIIAQGNNEPAVVYADIDLPRMASLRRSFPCNEHHVLD